MICNNLSFNVIRALTVFDLKSFQFQKAALTFKGLAFPGIAGCCTNPPINLKFVLLSFNLDFSERFILVQVFFDSGRCCSKFYLYSKTLFNCLQSLSVWKREISNTLAVGCGTSRSAPSWCYLGECLMVNMLINIVSWLQGWWSGGMAQGLVPRGARYKNEQN